MKLIGAFCLAALVGCISSVDIDNELGEIVYVRNSRAASGSLRCNGAMADFYLGDSEIYNVAFVDPTIIDPRTKIEAVWIGPNKPGCSAYRYPTTTNHVVAQKSFRILVGYNECGFIPFANNDLIQYTNYASATILHPAPAGGVSRRRTYRIPLSCFGAANGNITSTPVQYFESITYLPGLASEFDITMRAISQRFHREEYANMYDVQVFSLDLELDAPYRADYAILGSSCWITTSADASSQPSYNFIKPQGCTGGDEYVVVNTQSPSHHIYEVLDFTFDDAPNAPFYWFHCNVNVCKRGLEGRCKQSCRNGRLAIGKNADHDIGMTSGKEERPTDPNYKAKIRVDRNGVVHRV